LNKNWTTLALPGPPELGGCEFRRFVNYLCCTPYSDLLEFIAKLFSDERYDKEPVTEPILAQLSGPKFIAFIFSHLSMPMRAPKGKSVPCVVDFASSL
jgi:hypothetical protein